jgi:pimeloyl-ACP methyl ester carboxylesterase
MWIEYYAAVKHHLMKTFPALMVSFLFILQLSAQPFDIKYMQLNSQQQELKMAYLYEKATTQTNKTIVLLHGKNFSSKYWHKTMSFLLKQGYHVLAPDQIGFGNSSMPDSYQYSFQQLAYNTKKLIDTLGITKPIIIGHSMGGMLAIRYALMYQGDCAQLILEGPIGLEDWKLLIPYTAINDLYKSELKKDNASLKKYMLENYFHNEWKTSYDSLLHDISSDVRKKNYAWNMALTSDMLYTQPVVYELEHVKVKTILIVGELDRTAPGKEKADDEAAKKLGNYPVLAKAAAARIPNCELHILKGIGHIPHEEDFTQFTGVLTGSLGK